MPCELNVFVLAVRHGMRRSPIFSKPSYSDRPKAFYGESDSLTLPECRDLCPVNGLNENVSAFRCRLQEGYVFSESSCSDRPSLCFGWTDSLRPARVSRHMPSEFNDVVSAFRRRLQG